MENTWKQAELASVDEQAAHYGELADRIWEKPELSLKEHSAAALFCVSSALILRFGR